MLPVVSGNCVPVHERRRTTCHSQKVEPKVRNDPGIAVRGSSNGIYFLSDLYSIVQDRARPQRNEYDQHTL